MPPLSHRLPHTLDRNALTVRLDQLRAAGVPIADLTVSNPTRVGLAYPADLLAPLSSPEALTYTPSPLGVESARQAVAGDYARRGACADARDVVLTASTSEAYSWLFKLVCNPGERVLVPRPSYPLFEHLARLEGVGLETYDLEWHGRWEVDFARVRRASSDVRALIVVSPNNPTGSCLSHAEFDELTTLCRERQWTLIADEVFSDYLLESTDVPRDFATRSPCLTMTLGGLSKAIGLPQLKLGWVLFGGPEDERTKALTAMEVIADSFLSVSTPVQVALPHLLARGAAVREAIQDRLTTNLAILRETAARWPQCDVPRVDGGWSAVIRIPATRPEEAVVLELLERAHVLVHPGFFFDFHHEAFLVISLLVSPDVLRAALPTVFEVAA